MPSLERYRIKSADTCRTDTQQQKWLHWSEKHFIPSLQNQRGVTGWPSCCRSNSLLQMRPPHHMWLHPSLIPKLYVSHISLWENWVYGSRQPLVTPCPSDPGKSTAQHKSAPAQLVQYPPPRVPLHQSPPPPRAWPTPPSCSLQQLTCVSLVRSQSTPPLSTCMSLQASGFVHAARPHQHPLLTSQPMAWPQPRVTPSLPPSW